MDQGTAAAAETTETPQNEWQHSTKPAPPDADDIVVDLNELRDDDGDEVVETKALDGSPSALILATQALEALTEAVEVLGTLPEEEARARVAEIARQLRIIATRIGGAMNAGEMPVPPTADTGPDLGSVIASVRSVLELVGQMIAQPAPDATLVEGKQPNAAKADDALDAVVAKLDSVVTELRAIGETVKTQQQRLSRMEKRFGLPNSAPIGESPTRAEDEADVGWPLDLNRSLDRESVDKAISFHDV